MFVHLKIHSLRVYYASKFDPIRVHKRGENTSHHTQRVRETGKSRKIIAKWSKISATLIVNQLAGWCTFGKRIMCFLVFFRFRCGNKGRGNGYGVFRSFLWFLDFYCEDCPFWKPPQFTHLWLFGCGLENYENDGNYNFEPSQTVFSSLSSLFLQIRPTRTGFVL